MKLKLEVEHQKLSTRIQIFWKRTYFLSFFKKYALTRSVFETLSPVHKKTTEIRSPAKNVKSRKKLHMID